MKKIIIIVSVNIMLLALQLGLAVGRSADGVQMANINDRLTELSEENAVLSQEVQTKSSLSYIASKSAQLGLTKTAVRFVPQANVAAARLSP